MGENEEGENKWWWKSLGKMNNPLKTQIFMWLALSDKVLTWVDCKKRHGRVLVGVLFAKVMMNLFIIFQCIVLTQNKFGVMLEN
jgi:hypothetical protein